MKHWSHESSGAPRKTSMPTQLTVPPAWTASVESVIDAVLETASTTA